MKQWIEPKNYQVPDGWLAALGISEVVGRVLYRRGYKDLDQARQFLDPSYYIPSSPYALMGMEIALERLVQAKRNQELVLIWGDFDVDGQTATAVLYLALNRLGIPVCYYVPIRKVEPHGIHADKLAQILNGEYRVEGTQPSPSQPVQILLTCDTGISSNAEVDLAKSMGVDVIITDHHEVPIQLPNALVVINPKLGLTDQRAATLPGVGVAFKLVEALYQHFGIAGEANNLLDLVAVGIVADVALQVGDTRFLLQMGLKALQSSRCLGLVTIINQAEIKQKTLNEEHIAFEIAPRLNAIGRLGDANLAVSLLTTGSQELARHIAFQIEGMNNHRKLLTSQVFQGVLAQIERDPNLLDHPALILSHPEWPAGILGICASRLVERFNKPAILMQENRDGPSSGSARSVEGINITSILNQNAKFLLGYGGHSMAAGFSIDGERIAEFRQALYKSLQKIVVPAQAALEIDNYVLWDDVNLDLAAQLERLAPFGPGNPPILLASRDLIVSGSTTLGRQAEHLSLVLSDSAGHKQKVIWWHGAGFEVPDDIFDLAFTLRSTNYRGKETLQVEWVDARIRDLASKRSTKIDLDVLDFRTEKAPLKILKALIQGTSVLVWAEGKGAHELAAENISFLSRDDLTAIDTLIIWSIPPSSIVLRQALEMTKPRKVVLFAQAPGFNEYHSFISRLAGLVKYMIVHQDGFVDLRQLAVELAAPRIAIQFAMELLTAKGYIIPCREENRYKIVENGKDDPKLAEKEKEKLKKVLAETRAYRQYYLSSKVESIIGY